MTTRRIAKSHLARTRRLLPPIMSLAAICATAVAQAAPLASPQAGADIQKPDRQGGSVPIDNGIRVLHQDLEGSLWIATQNGVERLANGNLEVLLVGEISADIASPFAEEDRKSVV